jgi:hypothetical protein
MSAPIEFRQRIGPDPHANGRQTIALNNCPDIWELANGDFAVIGIDITDIAKPNDNLLEQEECSESCVIGALGGGLAIHVPV